MPPFRGPMDEGRGPMAGGPGGRGEMGQDLGPMAGGPVGPDVSGLMMGGIGGYTPSFRPLIQETCFIGAVSDLTDYPRIPLHKKLWPYHMDES